MDVVNWESMFKLIGYSAILVLIWVLTMKFFGKLIEDQKGFAEKLLADQASANAKQLQDQKEFFTQVLSQYKGQFDSMLTEYGKRNDQNFEVLNKFADAIEFLGGQQANLNSAIATNTICPIVRKDNGK